MAQRLRVGIIGCGRIAGLLEDDPLRTGVVTHIGAYRAFPKKYDVIACASRTQEHADAFARRFSLPHAYKNYRTMLKECALDVVSVCAYADTRAAMIRAAGAAGVKAVFAEKPLATSIGEAKAVTAYCRRKNVVLMVNHTRRWGHDYRTIREAIAHNKIGKVRSVVCHFSGALFHTGTHMFDILNFLFGKPRFVIGRLTAAGRSTWPQVAAHETVFEDFDGTGLVGYRDDVIVSVVGTPRPYFLFEIDIHGEKGRIRIGNNVLEVYTVRESRHYRGFSELERVPFAIRHYKYSALEWAVWELARAVQTKKPVSSSGDDARWALEIACALCESSGQGNRLISLPLKKSTVRVRAR